MSVTLGMILEARERLKGVAQRTGLVQFKALSDEQSQVYLKTEDLQNTGSFKVRGAYIKIASLSEEERACGVIASSAGNHAQGVALAAKAFGVPATIVMPAGAPLSKVKATRELGANVVLHGTVYDDAYAEACRIQQETGATFIHPFDDPMVIAGQGTIGLEIMDDLPDVRTIVVPIGGGGLASGVAAAVKMLHPNVRVIGVQASGAAGMKASMDAGHVVALPSAKTIADGIAVKKPGELTFALCSKYLDEIVTVDDDEIAQAILFLMERGGHLRRQYRRDDALAHHREGPAARGPRLQAAHHPAGSPGPARAGQPDHRRQRRQRHGDPSRPDGRRPRHPGRYFGDHDGDAGPRARAAHHRGAAGGGLQRERMSAPPAGRRRLCGVTRASSGR